MNVKNYYIIIYVQQKLFRGLNKFEGIKFEKKVTVMSDQYFEVRRISLCTQVGDS